MGLGQRPGTQASIHEQPRGVDVVQVRRALPVAQLTHVVVALLPVGRTLDAVPSEEDVAGGLHEALPGDHALPGVVVLAAADELLEDRRLRFLRLQEQRVLAVTTEHQQDPRPGAHTSHTHHLQGGVDVFVGRQQMRAIRGQSLLVPVEDPFDLLLDVERLEFGPVGGQVGQAHDQWRLIDDPRLAVDHLGELVQCLHGVPGARLGDRLGRLLHGLGRTCAFELLELLLEVHVGVPDLEIGHLGEPHHRDPVGLRGAKNHPSALLLVVTVGAAGDLQTGDETLHVPLPRPGCGLIEVVDVEDEPALRGAEDSEVGKVGVTAGLDPQAGVRSRGQVRGHDQCRTPVERERRHQHAAVPDRDQFRHPAGRLRLEQRHGIRTVRSRVERPVAGSRCTAAGGLAPGTSFLRGGQAAGCGHVRSSRHLPSWRVTARMGAQRGQIPHCGGGT